MKTRPSLKAAIPVIALLCALPASGAVTITPEDRGPCVLMAGTWTTGEPAEWGNYWRGDNGGPHYVQNAYFYASFEIGVILDPSELFFDVGDYDGNDHSPFLYAILDVTGEEGGASADYPFEAGGASFRLYMDSHWEPIPDTPYGIWSGEYSISFANCEVAESPVQSVPDDGPGLAMMAGMALIAGVGRALKRRAVNG